TDRSSAKTNVCLDAGHLHLHARQLPGRSCHLLDMEQYIERHPTDLHHEECWGQSGVMEQSERELPKEPIDLTASSPPSPFDEAGQKLFRRHCGFLSAAAAIEQLPAVGAPEVAFAGRSNVGKSSLLNALTNRSRLARTSNSPGRTQQLNFFA